MHLTQIVWPLMAATFASGTQAYVFAGLLGDIARDLGISVGMAGQLATTYAIAFAIGAPLAAGFVGHRERRGVIVTALIAVAIINAFAAAAPNFVGLLGLRIAAGLAAACVLPMAAAAAILLVPAEARGRALGLVTAGTTIAFMTGIPVGSVIGGVYGWRATFAFAALLAAAAAIAIRWRTPVIRPIAPSAASLPDLLRAPGVLIALATTFLAFAATFTVVAYVGPVVTAVTATAGAGVGLYQLCIGAGSLLGAPLGGALVDRGHGQAVALGVFGIMMLTLSGYSALLSGQFTFIAPALLALIILTGAAALFTVIPAMQARLVAAAPDAAPLLLGFNGSVMFLGQGAGALFGGVVADHLGFAAIGAAGASVAFAGLIFTLASRRRQRLPLLAR